jgi:hypothetical protein
VLTGRPPAVMSALAWGGSMGEGGDGAPYHIDGGLEE